MTKNKKNHHIPHKTEEKCCEKGTCCAKKDIPVVTVVADECSCASECKCGPDCKCGSKSSRETLAKCVTTLVSALMVSTAILFAGMELARPQPVQRHVGNIDIQITDYMRKNAAIVSQLIAEHQEKIESDRKAEAERARMEAEKKQAEKVKEYMSKIIDDKTNYSLGNKDGKYVIIEFFDYRCGWCKKTNKAIWDEIKDNKAPNIRWIPIDAPIFGEGSALISRYVLAAGKQGKYSEMHHEVAEATGNLDQEALVKLGEKVGLNIDQLKKDAESDEIKAKLEANIAMAREIGVQGVPFMIVNGKPRGGALLGDALAKAVKESNEMK